MGRTFVNTADSHQPRWEVNQAVVVEGGRLVLTSSILGTSAEGTVAKGDVEAQAAAAFANMDALLRAAGGSMASIVRLTVYLAVDFGQHRAGLKAIRDRYLSSDYPASSMVRVAGFANPDALIALEAVAQVA